jgi:hypothetical protein
MRSSQFQNDAAQKPRGCGRALGGAGPPLRHGGAAVDVARAGGGAPRRRSIVALRFSAQGFHAAAPGFFIQPPAF